MTYNAEAYKLKKNYEKIKCSAITRNTINKTQIVRIFKTYEIQNWMSLFTNFGRFNFNSLFRKQVSIYH